MPSVTHSQPVRPAPTAVIKLGGSLLDLPDLSQRLDQLRPEWGPRPLLVVGGGNAANLVRDWDRQHQLGEERAHWLALDSLLLTTRLLASLWPPARLARREEFELAWEQDRVPLAIAREWFDAASQSVAASPPQTWHTTTDTIAAWIAALTHAESLWLLKSVACPASVAIATQLDLVDPQFAEWTPPGTPIRWVNLREALHLPNHVWLIAECSLAAR